MARYSVGIRTAAAAAATFGAASAAYLSLWAPATTRARLRQLEVYNTTATAAAFGLIRTTARGTQSTTQAGNQYDPNDVAGIIAVDSAWSVNPTIGATTTMLKRGMVPAAIGGGVIWVFAPDELPIANNNSLALINPTGTGQILDVVAVWDE